MKITVEHKNNTSAFAEPKGKKRTAPATPAAANFYEMGANIYMARYIVILLLAIWVWVGCNQPSGASHTLDSAQEIMERKPDSALFLLDRIDKGKLIGTEEKARYALLKSMALDKNYIDTTTFAILQPAIDYYITDRKGDPDSRLRTLYYQGRIFQNMGDLSHAMTSFSDACATASATDTLTLARSYVAMSVLDYNSYRSTELTGHALAAASLYQKLRRPDLQVSCLLKALDGCIADGNRRRADSILRVCGAIHTADSTSAIDIACYRLAYALDFGNAENIRQNIDSVVNIKNLPEWAYAEIARGYLKLGKPEQARKYIEAVNPEGEMAESYKYLLVKSDTYEACGLYREALESFREYATLDDLQEMENAKYALAFAQQQYSEEIRRLGERQRSAFLLASVIVVLLALVIILIIMVYRRRLDKANLRSQQKDNEHLLMEQKLMALRNFNLELERNNAMLQRERLRLEMDRMETEIETLKEVLHNETGFSHPMKEAVKERIMALNTLMASIISNNDSRAATYEKWKQRMLHDSKAFMNSTRLALAVSHPELISHLERHGLTEQEINYTCLYALGLNGKEIGKYIHLQRHYHISSDIRTKLGLESSDVNLSTYIRNLMK